MAAPRNGLGTHDRSRLLLSQFEEPLQSRREGRRLHVVGKSAERSIAPAGIDRIVAGAITGEADISVAATAGGGVQSTKYRMPSTKYGISFRARSPPTPFNYAPSTLD